MITINTLEQSIKKNFKELTDDEKIKCIVFFFKNFSEERVHFNILISKQDISLFESFFKGKFCEILNNENQKSIIFKNGNAVTYIKEENLWLQ